MKAGATIVVNCCLFFCLGGAWVFGRCVSCRGVVVLVGGVCEFVRDRDL